MKRSLLAIGLIVLTVPAAVAQEAEEMSYGEAEYMNSCAVCHGESARGDGPLAQELVKRPADLTKLAEKNGGEFPYSRVFSMIDGRYVVSAHGDREMPVWGRAFVEEDRQNFGQDAEMVTAERIHELTQYIQSLQR
jgi:mono/diheme cytochrome c family protein